MQGLKLSDIPVAVLVEQVPILLRHRASKFRALGRIEAADAIYNSLKECFSELDPALYPQYKDILVNLKRILSIDFLRTK